MKISLVYKRLAQGAAVVFVALLLLQTGIGAKLSAAAPDPTKSYLYGATPSDCATGDFPTSDVTGTNCLRLSNDKSTYTITAAPAQGACPNVYGFDGVKAQGPFGQVCVYFTTKSSLVTDTSGIDFKSSNTKVVTPQSCQNGTTLGKDSNGNDTGTCVVSGTCDSNAQLDASNCSIIGWVVIAINTLSALVGLTVVIMIIVAGIQYSSAGDDPQKTAQAKSRIVNAIIALVTFIFMYAFLQWIIPGGVL